MAERADSSKREISPEEVLQFTKPCEDFLCPLEANIYKIEFLDFEVIDDASSEILFKVQRELDAIPDDDEEERDEDDGACDDDDGDAYMRATQDDDEQGDQNDALEDGMRSLDIGSCAQPSREDEASASSSSRADEMRTIRYSFPRDFLDLSNIRTHLKFCVNQNQMPVENFRMIERHYFKDKLIRSFDFDFGFCVPGSTNSWDALYPLPSLKRELKEEMVSRPFLSRSDSFYFAGSPPTLIMHNMAEYEWT